MRRHFPSFLVAGPAFLVVCWGLLSLPPTSQALTLTTPCEGEILHSGASISVSVRVEDTANVSSVRYFWFRVGEESVGLHQADPAEFHPRDPKRPLDGTLVVPNDAIGHMRLLAVGEIVRGRLAGHQDFDEVVVTVEPEAALSTIEFAVEKPWRLDMLGKRLPVPVFGQFDDGTARPLYGHGTGSMFHSSNDGVIRVDQQGKVLVVGNGKAVITAANRQKEGRLEVIVEGDATPNRSPEAVVPSPVTVKPGAVVHLNGLKSRDRRRRSAAVLMEASAWEQSRPHYAE